MLQLLDANRNVISFPYSLGSFTDGESPYQLLWLYNPDAISYQDLTIKIEQDTDDSYNAWGIAKDFKGRAAGFADYLSELHFYMLPAYSWTRIWVKFMPEKSTETANLQQINLRLIGEAVA